MSCVFQQYCEMNNTLPSDFMAEVLNGILMTTEPPSGINWNCVRLPELLLFIQKVLEEAKIEYNTTIVALILLSRLKKILPKNAHGEYGTCHRLFLSAIVVATKNLTQGQSYISLSQEETQLPAPGLLIENLDQPLIPPSPSSSSSDDSETQDETIQDTTNINLAEISGIFSVQEVNAMEKDLRKLLGQHIIVNENDVKKYVECNKYALGVC